MNGLYIGNNRMLIKTFFGPRMMTYADELSLMPDLVFTGGFDIPLTKFFLKNVKAGHKVIDAGANIGYFSILLGHLVGDSGTVWAYEASSRNFQMLRNNLAMNVLNNRVNSINKAVFSEEKTLSFFSSSVYTGSSSLFKPTQEYENKFNNDVTETEEVQAVVLDKEFRNEQIDFIKLDIEGAEYQAFLGMRELIESKRANCLIFELNRLRMQDQWSDFYSMLTQYQDELNASYYIIDNEGELVIISLDEAFAQDFVENLVMIL